MPIFRANDKLVFYAHVPKCGGSAVSWYLKARFGKIAFSDPRQMQLDPASRWSRTSPQHIDRKSLSRLFPPGFFDATFSIVRHPVDRLISAYHFQLEQEKSISERIPFSDWLHELELMLAENPFLYDNHVRPMAEIVPTKAMVFHMENGLDQLVLWLDEITGEQAEPRAIPKRNEKGSYSGIKSERVQPSPADLEAIARLYAADFERFGYAIDKRAPMAPATELSARQRQERDASLKAMQSPTARIARIHKKLRRKLLS